MKCYFPNRVLIFSRYILPFICVGIIANSEQIQMKMSQKFDKDHNASYRVVHGQNETNYSGSKMSPKIIKEQYIIGYFAANSLQKKNLSNAKNPLRPSQYHDHKAWTSSNAISETNIQIASVYSPPSVTYIEDGCTSKNCFKGTFANVWHSLAEEMNLTYTIRRAYMWGSEENGSWNGMIGMLKNGIVDIAAADLTITNERSKVVDFLPSLMEVTEGLYMRNPGDRFSIVSYMGPFTWLSWIAIGFWLILTPIMFLAITRHQVDKNEEKLSLVDSYIFVVSSLVNLGYELKAVRICSRIAAAPVFLGGIVMYYYWESGLIAHLAFKTTNMPFNTLKEFSDNTDFKLIVAQGSVFLEFFKHSDDPVRNMIWTDKLEPFLDQLPLLADVEKRIMEDPYTVAYDESRMKMTPAYTSCDIVDIKPPIRKTQLAFATRRNFPLHKAFKYHVNKMKQAGLVQKCIKSHKIEDQVCKDYSGRPVLLHQCFMPFKILAAGMVMAFLGYILETFVTLFKAKSRRDETVGRNGDVSRSQCSKKQLFPTMNKKSIDVKKNLYEDNHSRIKLEKVNQTLQLRINRLESKAIILNYQLKRQKLKRISDVE